MNLFSLFRDCFGRILERKKLLIAAAVIFLASAILGMIFIKTPALYSYHLTLCDRFIDRVCFSERNVFTIFFERLAGNAVYLFVILCAGAHIACLPVPVLIMIYRAYTFGGSIAIFFTVYRMTGVLIVFVLYLPVHLLLDAVFLAATVLSFSRAKDFCFSQENLLSVLRDFLLLLVLIAAICLLEMILLLVLFHPIGNLL